jgi:ATP/maltotriose-dependent transcriptional regulator MalT
MEESGEAYEVRSRHISFFLTLAEEAETEFWGPEEAAWMERLEEDHDNLRAVLSRSLGSRDSELGLRLAAALSRFWHARGYYGEGTMWLEEALAQSGAVAPAVRAETLTGLGTILGMHTSSERGKAYLEEAIGLWEEIGNPGRVAECLNTLGWLGMHRGDGTRVKAIFEKALAAARESGEEKVVSNVLLGLGWFAFDGGDFERAQELWEEALVVAREMGNAWNISMVLMNVGHAELVQGNYQRATALNEEVVDLGRKLGSDPVIAHGLISLGLVATLGGDPKRGKKLSREGLAIELELGRSVNLVHALQDLAGAAAALGENVRAARLWGAAEALRADTGVAWQPEDRLLHEPLLMAIGSRLDKAAFEEAFAEGKAMNLADAAEYALSEEESAPPTTSALEELPGGEQPTRLTTPLSPREQEVATLVAQGLTNRQISTELMLSEHTVATHMRNVLKKLGLNSRNQIAAYFTEQR